VPGIAFFFSKKKKICPFFKKKKPPPKKKMGKGGREVFKHFLLKEFGRKNGPPDLPCQKRENVWSNGLFSKSRLFLCF